MTPHRLEGHLLLRTWWGLGKLLQAVELTIGGHDATTRRRADLNAHT